jgi:hypothetical protein
MTRRINYQLFTALFFGAAMFLVSSCTGPAGPAGKDGINGTNGADGLAGLPGKDANETCKLCHNPTVVQAKATQYELSKHSTGVVASEEAGGSTGCTPCHESEGFKYVCANNVSTAFTLVSGKYVNSYAATASTGYGQFTCNTCHSSLHKTYDIADFYPLTNVAAVPMTMWGGTKTIDLTQDNSKSNLCVKCHQPRPLTTSTTLSDGNIVDYASLVANPTAVYYDSAVGNAAPNKLVPSYRTHVHYGGVGAIFAGKGGVEFTGTVASYASSAHATVASCENCHMADMTNAAGGHSFVAKGNFTGCNVTGCHSTSPLDATSAKVVGAKTAVKALLETLGAKLTSGGVGFLHQEPDPTLNMWAGLTSKNYDGYVNIYDPSTNPLGAFRNPAPAGSWTAAQKATNLALPKFTSLKNVQLGAMINFQLCLREFSMGVHNTNYSKALLQNTIDAMTAAGF